jgi:hypothetical protein
MPKAMAPAKSKVMRTATKSNAITAAPSEQAESEQTESEQAESEQAESEQAESEQAESEQAESKQAESEQAESEQAESEQAESEQAESEPSVLAAPVTVPNDHHGAYCDEALCMVQCIVACLLRDAPPPTQLVPFVTHLIVQAGVILDATAHPDYLRRLAIGHRPPEDALKGAPAPDAAAAAGVRSQASHDVPWAFFLGAACVLGGAPGVCVAMAARLTPKTMSNTIATVGLVAACAASVGWVGVPGLVTELLLGAALDPRVSVICTGILLAAAREPWTVALTLLAVHAVPVTTSTTWGWDAPPSSGEAPPVPFQ